MRNEQRRLRGQALWRCRFLPFNQFLRNSLIRRKERVTGCANSKQVAEMCREKRWLWGPTNSGCFLFLCSLFRPSTSFFSLDVNPWMKLSSVRVVFTGCTYRCNWLLTKELHYLHMYTSFPDRIVPTIGRNCWEAILGSSVRKMGFTQDGVHKSGEYL